MHFGESFDCFQFDKDKVFNDQVNAESTADRYTLIRNSQGLLALESDTSKGQFSGFLPLRTLRSLRLCVQSHRTVP